MSPTVEETLMDESATKSNSTQQQKTKKNLRHEEKKKNRSLEKKFESVKCDIDDLRQQNISQFECSEKHRCDIDERDRKIKQLEEDCANLKNTVLLQNEEYVVLEKEYKKLGTDHEKTAKELDEFKRIKMVQENCIECAEIEIERLREKLKHCEKTVSSINENMEISKVINLQDIIDDLKLKLLAANTEIEKLTTNCSCAEVQLKKSRFHVTIAKTPQVPAQQSVEHSSTNINSSCVSINNVNIIRTEMTPTMKESTILTVHELLQCSDSIELIPDLLVKKMNKRYGKHWHCFMGEKFMRSAVKYVDEAFMLFEISRFSFVLFQTTEQPVKEKTFDQALCEARNNKAVKVHKKSVNFESDFEKFVVKLTCEGIDRNHESYYTLSAYIRDAICAKYSTQWFVSVGETKYYGTSWSLSKNRKFLLFEVNNIKFTIGEVGGWLF